MLIILMGVLGVPSNGHAQDGGETPAGAQVEAQAADGLTLVGDFYAVALEDGSPAPAVILMHMLRGSRNDWTPLIPVLVNDYQIAVLTVDLRGHGETGGSDDWALAEQDVQTWIDWLRGQEGVNPAAVSLIGASIGSNLTLRGWANDAEIRTAVALSPGLDYRGVTTADAVEANANRPLMLVAARDDRASAEAVVELFTLTDGSALVRMVEGSLHGTRLFGDQHADWLLRAIAEWVALQSS
jgi:pimeloyl-ACP methyl ester carboxylesterase